MRGRELDCADEALARCEGREQLEVTLARRVQPADQAVDDARTVRRIEAKPRDARRLSLVAYDSSARTTVVPTAITRPRRARAIASSVRRGIS